MYRAGKYELALESFEAALSQRQNCSDLGGAGLCCLRLGKPDKAQEYAERMGSCREGLARDLDGALNERPNYRLTNFGPTSVEMNGKIPYQVSIVNGGGGGNGSLARVTLEITQDNVVLFQKEFDAPSPHETQKVNVNLPATLSGKALIQLDPQGLIWESDKTDNELWVSLGQP